MAPGQFIYILIYIIMLYTYKNIFLNGIEGRNWPSDTLVPTPDLVNISIFEICSVNIFMLVTSQTTIVCEKFLGPVAKLTTLIVRQLTWVFEQLY